MNEKTESKLVLIAKKYGLHLTWQALRFGYKRAVITCESNEEYMAVRELMLRYKGFHVSFWAVFEGEFEGEVYVMDKKDHDDLQGLIDKEMARVEDWWQRYHVADTETRRLMACGAIE